MELFDIRMDDSKSLLSVSREHMDDDVIATIIKAIEDDSDSVVGLLSTPIWDVYFENSTSPLVFNSQWEIVLQQGSPDEDVLTFLRDKISIYTKTPVEYQVVRDILKNTQFSGNYTTPETPLKSIPSFDLEEMVRKVMIASNLDHPWYKMWHASRDITRTYRPFNTTSYPGYFEAAHLKDMICVAFNMTAMYPSSASSVCVIDGFTRRYEIEFYSLADLVEHKFTFKASTRNDKFITYDGSIVRLRALKLYDILVLKYMIKYFDCDTSRSIYQFLASMMLSERDVNLAHDIGWFSGIPWSAFSDARREMYQLPDPVCELDTYLAISGISKDNRNLAKGFIRDFKYQSSASPANIWIAVTSLIFALVSVIQFFKELF
ncbi:hypothetical protein BGW38_004602 [Lunasporangiospora selenospora]|uniref:Uncharacterized protein n=1 Tax=Lunasporangiospora selenospora TaxID=979761 RepID=A0A9P6FP39_9FUNG|nr:hypothetical protein BGW38_004602 [Lunasporangiospora selenospora]